MNVSPPPARVVFLDIDDSAALRARQILTGSPVAQENRHQDAGIRPVPPPLWMRGRIG